MKIAFVGHSHHQVTRSSEFFLNVLEKLGRVHCIWDDSWTRSDHETASVAEDADLVVVWQSVRYIQRLASQGHPNLVYVPMYDASKRLRRSFWSRLSKVKVLQFSSSLHQQAQTLGAPLSAYFQYFPDPADYSPVSDFSTLRGFFWQRQPNPNWKHVHALLAGAHFQRFHLHLAMDPGAPPPVEPTPDECRALNLELTRWLPRREDLLERLADSNVYFAPRLDEGIGMAFLEAMAMGMAVCANRSPTHTEYIVDRVNGYSYSLDQLTPPDWSKAEEVGKRARDTIEVGFARWHREHPRLLEFLTDRTASLAVRRYAGNPVASVSALPKEIEFPTPIADAGTRVTVAEGGKRVSHSGPRAPRPLVTLATVVRNAPAELSITLSSCLEQDFSDKEILVIDGASEPETLAVLQAHADRIDFWRSEPDHGPYDAMNKAAEHALGHWIMFINAGDYFVDSGALERMMASIRHHADFIAAHHVYISPDGREEIHRSVAPQSTYRRLLAGDIDGTWLGGIPGHQSLLTRTDLIRTHRYDLNLRIAADHDFLFRMCALGASFEIAPVIVTTYVGGGLSWKHLWQCFDEWHAIAMRHTQKPAVATKRFRRLRYDTLRALRRLSPFDWRQRVIFRHPWLAAAAEAEFHLRALLDRLDGLYLRCRAF